MADQPSVPLRCVIGFGAPLFVGCRKAILLLVFRKAELSYGFRERWWEAKLLLVFRKARLLLVFREAGPSTVFQQAKLSWVFREAE